MEAGESHFDTPDEIKMQCGLTRVERPSEHEQTPLDDGLIRQP
jgi:hypothetical protein